MEAIMAYILVGFCCIVVGYVIRAGIDYRKEIKRELQLEEMEKHRPIEISMEQLQELVAKGLDEEKPFDEQVMDWIVNGCTGANLMERSDPNVEIVAPCVGYECSCSPSREDCCPGDYEHGKCKIVININKLCGIDDYVKNPKLITATEAAQLAKALTEYLGNQGDSNE